MIVENMDTVFFSSLDLSVRILYNPFNIDSAYSVCVAAERLKMHNPSTTITAVAVDHVTYEPPVAECDVVLICGVNITVRNLLKELEIANPVIAIQFGYNNSTSDDNYDSYHYNNGKKLHRVSPKSFMDNSNDTENVTADDCISVIVNEYFNVLNIGTDLTEQSMRLMSAINTYINMRSFPSIFEKMPDNERCDDALINTGKITIRDRDDLAFLYRNFSGIQEAAEKSTPYMPLLSGIEPTGSYSKVLTSVRKLIHRNITEKLYCGKSKYFKAQTVMVSEENAFEVMRQLSLALPTVITYEDIHDRRVWRFYSTAPGVIDIFREAVEPFEVWGDCKITYMSSSLPRVSEKIS